jgi:menaquinone-dependent protoporphyrinogen IX oxidase
MNVLVAAASKHGATEEIAQAVGRALTERGLTAHGAVVRRRGRLFSGRLDRKNLGLAERAMIRAVHAEEGDFRDWTAIAAWANEIADTLAPP